MKISFLKSAFQFRFTLLSIAVVLGSTASLLPVTRAAAACSALPTDKGSVTNTITLPTAGTYRVWSRIMAPDTTNNSYILQIDQTTCGVVVGDSASIPANTWTWVDYSGGNTASPIDVALTAGTHTIVMAGREAGVKIDRVELTTDTSCTPTGTGDNCATVPNPNAMPDLVVTSVGPTTAVGGTATTFTATVKNQGTVATPAGTIVGVSFSIDGTVVSWSDSDTSSLAPGASVILTANSGPTNSATWAATQGSHTLVADVDNVNRIPETDETNNTLSNTIVVSAPTPPPTCTNAPSVPTGLKASATTNTSTTISWTASTAASNCTLSGYHLFRGSTKIADIPVGTTAFVDSGLIASTVYSYTVTASDTSSHTSAASTALSVTTSAATVTPPTPVPGDTNGDNVVNSADIATIIHFWGKTVPKGTDGDLSGNGMVDTLDITILIHYWPR